MWLVTCDIVVNMIRNAFEDEGIAFVALELGDQSKASVDCHRRMYR